MNLPNLQPLAFIPLNKCNCSRDVTIDWWVVLSAASVKFQVWLSSVELRQCQWFLPSWTLRTLIHRTFVQLEQLLYPTQIELRYVLQKESVVACTFIRLWFLFLLTRYTTSPENTEPFLAIKIYQIAGPNSSWRDIKSLWRLYLSLFASQKLCEENLNFTPRNWTRCLAHCLPWRSETSWILVASQMCSLAIARLTPLAFFLIKG